MPHEIIPFDTMPWQDKAPGLRVKSVLRGSERIRLVEFGLDFVEPGWCDTGHVGYVVSGRFQVAFEDGIRAFKAGDGLHIPPDTPHRHHATDEVATVFLVETFG